jgi:hypothetical protein
MTGDRKWVGRGQLLQDNEFVAGVSYNLWVTDPAADDQDQVRVQGQLMLIGADVFRLLPFIGQREPVVLTLLDRRRLGLVIRGFDRLSGLYAVAGTISPAGL